MSRTKRNEDRRKQKFTNVYERWHRQELSRVEAAKILGRSELQFRRCCDQYEAEGLEGLGDRQLGEPSGKTLPKEVEEAILALYRKTYLGRNVQHFHEDLVKSHGFTLSYRCLTGRLQDCDLVKPVKRKASLANPTLRNAAADGSIANRPDPQAT